VTSTPATGAAWASSARTCSAAARSRSAARPTCSCQLTPRSATGRHHLLVGPITASRCRSLPRSPAARHRRECRRRRRGEGWRPRARSARRSSSKARRRSRQRPGPRPRPPRASHDRAAVRSRVDHRGTGNDRPEILAQSPGVAEVYVPTSRRRPPAGIAAAIKPLATPRARHRVDLPACPHDALARGRSPGHRGGIGGVADGLLAVRPGDPPSPTSRPFAARSSPSGGAIIDAVRWCSIARGWWPSPAAPGRRRSPWPGETCVQGGARGRAEIAGRLSRSSAAGMSKRRPRQVHHTGGVSITCARGLITPQERVLRPAELRASNEPA